MAGNWTPPWPSWRDGWPVKVGETAMSLIGPLRIDYVAIGEGGWQLWSNQSMTDEKQLYIIDEGCFDQHPTHEGEPCEFWQEGDPTMPCFVLAPRRLYEEG